jgi:hypothetical protein
LIGTSAHPTRQLKESVLAHSVGQGVGKLPNFNRVVVQILPKLCRLNVVGKLCGNDLGYVIKHCCALGISRPGAMRARCYSDHIGLGRQHRTRTHVVIAALTG